MLDGVHAEVHVQLRPAEVARVGPLDFQDRVDRCTLEPGELAEVEKELAPGSASGPGRSGGKIKVPLLRLSRMEAQMVDRYTARMPAGTTRRLLTTADYHSMVEAGILGPEDRVELLGGEIYEAAAVGSPHAACVVRLNEWFSTRVGGRALVSVQNPVELSALSEPEPDLMLLVRRESFYADRHPVPADVLLLIEVAVSSYELDRNLKLPLYAEAGIREVWLVAVEQQAVEVFRDPSAGIYRRAESCRTGETLAPIALPDLELGVSELFG